MARPLNRNGLAQFIPKENFMQLKWVKVFTYFYAREKIHLDLHAILNIRLLPLFNTFSSNLN